MAAAVIGDAAGAIGEFKLGPRANKSAANGIGHDAARTGSRSTIPEPSARVIIWFAAITVLAFAVIIAYDYKIGDPRLFLDKQAPLTHSNKRS